MTRTERYIVIAVVVFWLYKSYTFAGSASQSSAAFVRAGGNSNWTITVDPFAGGATSAVQP
jgi:hypothetical protein